MQRRKDILKKLTKELYQNKIPVNEGYEYVFSDDIYLPIYKSVLIVTKRTTIPLNLVEEMVLQLLSNEVYQIDELSKILGLNRRLLEITLADLYSRDLVEVSSNSCKLLMLGKKALLDLNRSEKKQDILKDIYIDALLGQIFDAENYQIIDNLSVYWNDNKLKTALPIGDIKNYINHFDKISEIFNTENKLILSDGMQPIKEELLTIDKVENIFVKFVKIPIHVYVSSNGMEIDILSAHIKTLEIFNVYKEVILEQINQKKILKNHFKYKELKEKYVGNVHPEKQTLYDELKSFYYKKTKIKNDYTKIEKCIFESRKLLDGEYKILLKYLVSYNDNIIIHIDNLENWAYDFSFGNLLQEILEKKEVVILYNECKDKNKTITKFKNNYPYIKSVEKEDNCYYICWEIGKYKLFAIPQKRNIINKDTVCITLEFYLENLNNC